ncbi:MAG TPA: DNA/RNA helicase domain-containing protein [Gemmatimonadaceae bacterium]|nr:DNA/RNA helicase domain-containing protein [Gemmatimonadaceae bacterium]
MSERPPAGWYSSLTDFHDTPPRRIRERLSAFIPDASPEQVRAWDDSIPRLQAEVPPPHLLHELAQQYSAILEYELPMESRRPDAVLLVGANVVVIELKGKWYPSQADLDQAAAYARDLRNYHRECHGHEVTAVLVPTLASGYQQEVDGVHVTGPDALGDLVSDLTRRSPEPVVDRNAFLDESAYRPLPTIVEAARELLASGSLRRIHKAHAATGPTVDEITRIVHMAAATKSRHLILVTGVPGAGKTLVGLQTVHAKYLDDLAVERADGKPTAPAVFLSGNGPLVEVLQYEMRSVGDGKTFVRGVKDYVKRYSRKRSLVPPEHVLVFDEAQRAFDADKARESQQNEDARSEPEEFIEFADRIPEWCVVVGLIGSGQEIHVGEEAGLGQWRSAVEKSSGSGDWTIHGPPSVAGIFREGAKPFEPKSALALDTELRFHQAKDLHRFVDRLLSGAPAEELAPMGARLNADGMHLRITRSLDTAKQYLRDRYDDDPLARFGLIASSKDRDLIRFGVLNDFPSTKRVRFGPWYGDDEHTPGGQSCRLLETCVTEFGAQGLELDGALLAWGTDLVWTDGGWSNARARGYKRGAKVKDPFQLRLNAYRVLLTRGRDGTVVFVPPLPELDGTYERLVAAGTVSLDMPSVI